MTRQEVDAGLVALEAEARHLVGERNALREQSLVSEVAELRRNLHLQALDPVPEDEPMFLNGGQVRATRLSSEERSDIARKAVTSRWVKTFTSRWERRQKGGPRDEHTLRIAEWLDEHGPAKRVDVLRALDIPATCSGWIFSCNPVIREDHKMHLVHLTDFGREEIPRLRELLGKKVAV